MKKKKNNSVAYEVVFTVPSRVRGDLISDSSAAQCKYKGQAMHALRPSATHKYRVRAMGGSIGVLSY